MTEPTQATMPHVAIVGGGPAGLMAAETAALAGLRVTLFDRMPSFGRKLLMAGRGGLNLTHAEDLPRFLDRYDAARPQLAPIVAAFPPAALIAWCEGLGQTMFTGSSRRVFPTALKASPLLRAWLVRLAGLGVQFRSRHHWTGWTGAGALAFTVEGADISVAADATILALGGASWPRLGADGGWVASLADFDIAPLRPANCGFTVAWSEQFRSRFEGQPLKRIAIAFDGRIARGEAMITAAGIEGGAIYALAGRLRDAIAAGGPATPSIDLRPDLSHDQLSARLAAPRRSQSLSTYLKRSVGLPPIAIGLLQEALHDGAADTPLATLIKAVPVTLTAPASLARAISTAGGLRFGNLDEHLMLRAKPGIFAAGEMLDWEAPTGGYLLQAAFSTGHAAGLGALRWLSSQGFPCSAAMPAILHPATSAEI